MSCDPWCYQNLSTRGRGADVACYHSEAWVRGKLMAAGGFRSPLSDSGSAGRGEPVAGRRG